MDETPVTFDLPGNITLDPYTCSSKTVLVKTSGHEKTHFTVIMHGGWDKSLKLVVFK